MVAARGTSINLRAAVPQRKLGGDTAQEHLWVAIRSLKRFSLAEVARAASTDTLVISEATALRYLRLLHDGGYLTIMRDAVAKTDEWRLVPRMNTGPKPPMLIQVSVVFDRNRVAVMGELNSAEVVL